MKRSISLLFNLLMSSSLFCGVPRAEGVLVSKIPADITSYYCQTRYPLLRELTFSWNQPALDETAAITVDFYGPCDHEPQGRDEIHIEIRKIEESE